MKQHRPGSFKLNLKNTRRTLSRPRRHKSEPLTRSPRITLRRRGSSGLFALTSPRKVQSSPRQKRVKRHYKTLVERLLRSIKQNPRRTVHLLPFYMPRYEKWMRTLDAISLLLYDRGLPTLYRVRYDLYHPSHEDQVYFVEFYVTSPFC